MRNRLIPWVAAQGCWLSLALAACDDGSEATREGAETTDADVDADASAPPRELPDGAEPSAGEPADGGAEPASADAQAPPVGTLDAAPSTPDATTLEPTELLDGAASAPDARALAVDADTMRDSAVTATDAGAPRLTPDAAAAPDGGPARTPDAAAAPDSSPPSCTPSCGTRRCGGDGCGGSCGACGAGQSCSAAGQCTWPARSFGLDVFPIFAAAGCPDCHDASSPAAGLDLSSAASARASLVGVAASQCAPARQLVAPGNPEASYLLNKLTGVGMCDGLPMPRLRPPLSSAQIELVRAWVGSGAAP